LKIIKRYKYPAFLTKQGDIWNLDKYILKKSIALLLEFVNLQIELFWAKNSRWLFGRFRLPPYWIVIDLDRDRYLFVGRW